MGTTRDGGQRYEGRLRRLEMVRLDARAAVEVITRLLPGRERNSVSDGCESEVRGEGWVYRVRTMSSGERISPVATAAAAATNREAHG